jgi:hypothetical protein
MKFKKKSPLKLLIQSQPNFAEMILGFMGISHRVLCKIKFGCGGHLGRRYEMPDTNLEGDHPRIISAKFGLLKIEILQMAKTALFKPECAQI